MIHLITIFSCLLSYLTIATTSDINHSQILITKNTPPHGGASLMTAITEKKLTTKSTIATTEINNTFTNMKLFSYAGSKTKFKQQFHEILLKMGVKKVGTYIEGFVGSSESMWHIVEIINADKIVINDFNPKIINLYKQIQENPQLVFQAYKMIEDKFKSLIPKNAPKVRLYDKTKRDEIAALPVMFKYVRDILNNEVYDYANAAAWLFVMNHNFNGLYGENKKGHTNSSFNWSTLDVNVDKIKTNLFNLSEFLNNNNVVFENMDIDLLISKYNDHDTMVYIDPPYVNSDVQYNKQRTGTKKKPSSNSFNDIKTHIKMIDSCKKFKYVMYSNNHDEKFVEHFDEYINFSRGRTVSTKKSKKSSIEILAYKINSEVVEKSNVEPIPVNNIDNFILNSNYNLKVGTAFSGLGCPEYILKKLDVNHSSEFVIENNKFCQETLKINHNPKVVLNDIKKVDTKTLPNVDLYVWGSPCQNFSMSATSAPLGRLGLEGNTGQLFWDGYRILKDLQPNYSIFENVKGLVNHDGGNTFKVIISAFEQLNTYDIYHQVINPIDIGGNTNRERIFIVLIKKDIDIKFNFPKNIINTKSIKDSLISNIQHTYLDTNDYISWERPIENQSGKLKKDFKWLKTKRHEQSRIFNISYPCPTIQRSGHILINDGVGVRLLVKEELKLIQGFDDTLDLTHLSNTQYKSQLGNTMEVQTMKMLLMEIVRLDKLYHQTKILSKINNTDYQPLRNKYIS
jgi:DNA-cytosine methyltransferase